MVIVNRKEEKTDSHNFSLASVMGIVFCGLSFFMVLFIIVRTLVWGDPVAGWPSLVCIIFLVNGIQLFCMGIMGQYLSKTYLEKSIARYLF